MAHEASVSWEDGRVVRVMSWRPHEDSNLGTRLRRAVLYPLSYGG